LRESGIWTVLLSLDDKQQLVDVRSGDLRDWQLEVAQSVDVYWTTWRAGADWLIEQGGNPWDAPAGADPRVFSPGERSRDIDVLWLGSAYGRRMELVRYLRDKGFRVHAVGSGWGTAPVEFEEMLDLYARSKVVLGMGGVGQSDRVKHLKGRD